MEYVICNIITYAFGTNYITDYDSSDFYFSITYKFKDIHNSWLYCFTNPLELGTRVSLSHRQLNVLVGRRRFTVLNSY